MTHFPLRRLAASAIVFATLGVSGVAAAQYVWLDERGIKQFSDMPPPASVPANRILKQPGGSSAPAATPVDNAAADAPPAKPDMTIAEKNADFRKRMAEKAEKEKKAADEARVAADKAKQCDRAREYVRMLESGARISRVDRSGERTYLTDEQREQEMRDARQTLANCK